jgi:hypothetical protein
MMSCYSLSPNALAMPALDWGNHFLINC